MFELFVVWCLAGTPTLEINAQNCVTGHTIQPDCVIGYNALKNQLPEGHEEKLVVRVMGCWQNGPKVD